MTDMELKLVYRFLRQVSDWVLDGYYSEVVVEGEENVNIEGPLIIASTHHNEMIDIASLGRVYLLPIRRLGQVKVNWLGIAATLPHRRHLNFWAKASMFKNPIGRAIMVSSGAIPVRRNPNNLGNGNATASSSSTTPNSEGELAARASLFRETTEVLKNGGVVGIFPEGTSCTGWRVFQTMPGAAWAALEYTRATCGQERYQRVQIVPTAITYTDKSRYMSRIHIRYGTPISLDDFAEELSNKDVDVNTAAQSVVRKVNARVELGLVELTVNAVDWETICATNMARQLLWTNEDDISLKDWVDVNQQLVASLDVAPSSPQATAAKKALCRYNALLHHSGIQHSVLAFLVPSQTPTNLWFTATKRMLLRLPLAFLRFSSFLPSFLFVLPGYFTGPLAQKVLAKRDEEEAHSQFKAIAGGLGISLNVASLFALLWKLQSAGFYNVPRAGSTLGKIVQVIGATYLSTSLLLRWHNLLVKANYRELKRFQTLWKILRFSILGPSSRLERSTLEQYTRPPHPAVNPFIKSKYLVGLPPSPPTPARISPAKLLPHLLEARKEASSALVAHLRQPQNARLREYLEKKGARLRVV